MLTIRNTEAIRQIEAAIGYTFRDKRLLVQVLTRKTYLKIDPEAPDNEVLEFYGDTLMSYHVTNYFMAKYAHMLEDGLFFMRTVEQFTDLRSHYVCNRYLIERVKALGLARYLRAQNRDAELRKDSEKAYADIFEALVGAIYLDSYQNDALIRAFILRQLGIEPRRAPSDIESFDYDSLLESPEDIPYDEPDENLLPVERKPAESPVAAKSLTLEEEISDTSAPETAPPNDDSPADNEEEAPDTFPLSEEQEQTALPVATEEKAPVPAEALAAPTTNREKLALLCKTMGYEQPIYKETPPNAPNARTVASCTLVYKDAKGKQVKISLNDSGKTLAEATEKAAAKILAKVAKTVGADTKAAPVKDPARPVADKPPKAVKAKKTAPAAETPTEETPVEDVPVAEISVEETPVLEAFAKETPVEELPVEEPPVEEAPAEEIPTTETPVEEVPVEEIPVAVTPVEEAPVEEIPVAETPVEEAPVEEISAEEVPVEEIPVAEPPVEEAPIEEIPAEEVPVEEIPVAEPPVEEAPVEEIPAEEALVEEIPVAETPVEEVPVEEIPVAETPAEKTLAVETSVDEAPVEQISVVEIPEKETPAEEVSVADAPKADTKPAKKTPAKKAPAKKKATPKKKAEATPVADTAKEPAPEEVKTEETKSEATKPAKKKNPPKKKAEAPAPVETSPVTAETAEPNPQASSEEKPAEAKKPRAPRKSRAKKATAPAEDKPSDE